MKAYLLKTILPRTGWYITARGTPARLPQLDTIPRVPAMHDKLEVLTGLYQSGHYGIVRDLRAAYKTWLLESYFN